MEVMYAQNRWNFPQSCDQFSIGEILQIGVITSTD